MTFDARDALAEPLNETWWRDWGASFVPPCDVPILGPYESTHPGFELLVAEACEPELCGGDFRDVGNGPFEVCLWDIWLDIGNRWASNTDPAGEDADKRRINAMQVALGRLSDDDRYVRP